MATRASSARTGAAAPAPDGPVILIVGEEDLLVERAVTAVVQALPQPASGAEPGTGVHDVHAADLAASELSMLTAPSLFGGDCVVIVRGAQDANVAVSSELGELAAAMPDGVFLVITHAGAAKGKSLLTALTKAGASRIDCPSIRRFGERMDFLRAELARSGRKADDSGLRALIDAVGTDLRDLASACDQLSSDTTGVINAQVVARYWRGKAEASGFSVADRTLGQVGTARGKGSDALAAELGMPSWKVDRVRQQLRGWSASGLARAHSAVAQADAEVKGEGASAGYALERAVRVIVASRSGER